MIGEGEGLYHPATKHGGTVSSNTTNTGPVNGGGEEARVDEYIPCDRAGTEMEGWGF